MSRRFFSFRDTLGLVLIARSKIKNVEGGDGINVLLTFVAALQPCSLPTILTGIILERESAALKNFSLTLSLLPSVLSLRRFPFRKLKIRVRMNARLI